MSRLVVKNLANSVTEDKLRKAFSAKGAITDIQLKFTKSGKFRHFGFVGFKTKEEAAAALEFFNDTFLNATKIKVEFCTSLGDPNKPQAWSKYATDSSAYHKIHGSKEETTNETPLKEDKKKNKDKVKDPTAERMKKYKNDPLFAEFLESHGEVDALNKIASSESDQSEESGAEEVEQEEKLADKNISDLEYLKLKTSGTKDEKKTTKDKEEKTKGVSVRNTLFTVKIRGLSCKAKKKDVKQFFTPLVPKSVRLCRQVKGIAYAGFKTEKDMKQALIKNKSFLAGRQLQVTSHSKPVDAEAEEMTSNKWADQQESIKNEETIAESGRIFVRNLSYMTSEHDIETLFTKYGPVTEVTVPIDRMSRKVKGFALVTFMVPENAAKAYSELDGSVFQGRMMHLLPGKAKKSLEELAEEEGLTYKQRQHLHQKAQAGSSHNWNSLFLGANAVADAMAKTYNTSKERVLDPTSRDSVAVRLALGETQLVASTRTFLEQNGIYLDAFNQAPKQRSKCVMLAKNLPAGTTSDELQEMFGKHGELGRIVLPPSGVTAIVEYMDPSEAKISFTRLAYSKFKNLPLYLEWAPEDTFLSKAQQNLKTNKKHAKSEGSAGENVAGEPNEEKMEEEDAGPPEEDATLFVKNINFTTTEDSLRQHFSKCGRLVEVTVAKKKDMKNPGRMLSMGYGFVRFQTKRSAETALKTLQHSLLDGHAVELKRSNRTVQDDVETNRKKSDIGKQTGTKLIVRNVPFQATAHEVEELFKVFGELKAVRLPRKMVGTGPHRGFAFVDYVTKEDAKKAFEALCQSTHLYGRRLVLEWAAKEESIDDLRKRTAQHFHQDVSSIKSSKKSILVYEEKEEEEED